MTARTLIYPVSTVQLKRRVYRPCMINLREPTTFDTVAPGDVARFTKESKKENLDARKIYAQKPYDDS